MLKTRLIPCLLLQNGLLVRSEEFSIHQIIGNPIHEVARFSEWAIDELIYIDISKDDVYDQRRDDARHKRIQDPLAILDEVARTCFVPLTWGGRIRTIRDIRERTSRGADKVTINTIALERPAFITEAAQMFGSQCIVVSIDVLCDLGGKREVYAHWGQDPTGLDPVSWARRVEELGAGEIFLNSIDRDGMAMGYDLDLIRAISEAVRIPVIACGGVGTYEHFSAGVKAGASAVSAANIFHFKELSDRNAKRTMQRAGIDVRL